MTGSLKLLDSMQRDANIQAAEYVARKAELGGFDTEFTMYGCAYLNRETDTMHYKISSQSEDIYVFLEESAKKEIYPGNVEKLTLKCPVPMGTKELIAQDVKKELAKELRKRYPKEFFVELYQLAEAATDNSARELLWAEADALEGFFEEELLRQFEALIDYSYSCRKIEAAEYRKLLHWLEEERKSMDDNFVDKDIFEKTIYGIAYEKNERLVYQVNAQRNPVAEKAHMLEIDGIFVTPVYRKTYWYNYQYRLADVITDFKADLKAVCENDYLDKIKKMKHGKALPEIAQIIEAVREKYGEGAAKTMMRYGCRWGIR